MGGKSNMADKPFSSHKQQFLKDLGPFVEGVAETGAMNVYDIEPFNSYAPQSIFNVQAGIFGVGCMRFTGKDRKV